MDTLPVQTQKSRWLGRYELLDLLGAGGMAEVFLAREPLPGGIGKLLVLKRIQAAYATTPTFQEMFLDEARIAVNLNHPCVVQTFGYGRQDDILYMVMEYVDGMDLLRLLRLCQHTGQRLPRPIATYIMAEVLKGLDYAHRKKDDVGQPLGIVHLDVSPQNILLSWDGAVKLTDFGIAWARDRQRSGIRGKYGYMSPEQARGEPVDRRSDLFSVGVVLWEAVVGRPLYASLSMGEALTALSAGQVLRPTLLSPDIPLELEAVILRALIPRAEDRYQTARDFHHDLRRFHGGQGETDEAVDSERLAAYLARLVPPEGRRGLLEDLHLSESPTFLTRTREIHSVQEKLVRGAVVPAFHRTGREQ